MRTLLQKYSDRGFQLLAFPCNQFGAQAPCSSNCERAYLYEKLNITAGQYPVTVFDKVDANGPHTAEPYKVVKKVSVGDVAWNYEKFLVDDSGKAIARFPTTTDPLVAEDSIRELLGLQPEDEAPASPPPFPPPLIATR